MATSESDTRAPPGAALLDRLGAALWIYDFDARRIVWANRAALRFWGAPDAPALSVRAVGEGLSPIAAERLRRLRADLEAHPGRVLSERWTLYPMGAPVLVEARLSLCGDRPGAMLVEARPEHRESALARRIAEAVNTMPVLVAMFDASGRARYANPAHRAMLGPGRDALSDLFADPRDYARLLAATAAQGTHTATLRADGADGPRWLEVQAVRVRDPVTGAPGAHCVTATDVTSAHETQAALGAAREAAEAGERVKDEFLARISHELRTPLNAVIGLSALMMSRKDSGGSSDEIAAVARAGGRMLSLVEDLLDFAEDEARGAPETAPGDAAALLEAAVEPFAEEASRKGLDIILDAAPPGARTPGDPALALSALRRLVGNAVKFAQSGCVRVTARVAANGDALFEVEDDGPGVSPADRERIFRRFEQGDGSASRAHGGMGIGLAAARRCVGALGGAIGVDGAAGRGARFWFTAPAGGAAALRAPASPPPDGG